MPADRVQHRAPSSRTTAPCSIALDSAWLLDAGLPATEAQVAALQHYVDQDDRRGFAEHIWHAPRLSRTVRTGRTTSATAGEIAKRLTAIRVDTLIAKLRHFQLHGVHATKIVAAFPELLAYAPETVTTKMNHFAQRGLNATKIVNAFPPVLGLALESVDAKIANLLGHHLDAAHCVNTYPQILGYAPESVSEKIANLSHHGIDTTAAINTFPGMLGYAPESVTAKIEHLAAYGLEPASVVNAFPQALGYASERISLTIAVLQCVDLWERVRNHWNKGAGLGILTVPIESLALMAGLAPEPFTENPTRAKRFATVNGWTTSDARRRALNEHLDARNPNNSTFVNRLDTFALLYHWRTTGSSPLCAIPAPAATAPTRSAAPFGR